MVLADPAACGPLAAGEAGDGVVVHGIRRAADAAEGDVDDVALVLAESFGAAPGRAEELAADLRLTLDDPRVALVLVRVEGEPAAVAKATSFDGFVYLSSIGTRAAFRGRGLAALATRHAVAIGGGTGRPDRLPRRVQRQHVRAAAVRAPRVRVDRRGTGPAARMTARAR